MCAGRQAFAWFFHGYAPGLIVTNRYRPSSSVSARPAPVKLGSSGAGWESCGWAYLPPAFACQTSTSVFRTGRPSPSSTRPCTMIRWPWGSSACWRVRSWSSSPTRPSPSSGPVVSVSDRGNVTSGRAGARRRVDRYAGYRYGGSTTAVVRAWDGSIGHVDTSVPPRDTGEVGPIQMEPSDGTSQTDRIERRTDGR